MISKIKNSKYLDDTRRVDGLADIYLKVIRSLFSANEIYKEVKGYYGFGVDADLAEYNYKDDLKKWVVGFLYWHKLKTKRVFRLTGLKVNDGFTTNVDVVYDEFASLISVIPKEFDKESLKTKLITKLKKRTEISREDLIKQIDEEITSDRKRAEFWAQDQTTKLNGRLDKEKHLASGYNKYIWLAINDSKTRPHHAELNNTVREYGDGIEPKTEYRCRCEAIPYNEKLKYS